MHLARNSLDGAIQVGLRSGFGNDRLRIGGLKVFVDGALGSRSAYMLEPFTGDPKNRGILVTDRSGLEDVVLRASAAGIASTIHAIGDAANRQALDVLERVRRQEPVRRLRHRIEHAQLVHLADIPRFARLNVIASMQPQHATADIDLVETYWRGERIAGAYAWRKLLDRGARLALGSDCPVETMNPLLGIHAAVTRRRADGYPGRDGWRPEERLSVEEAVRGFTMDAAYASGEEQLKGSLTPGKLADLVILSRDIFHIPPMEIAETRVQATVFDGRFVYGTPESLD
jgi:predicted amidohydrolase YtcJ